jgi:hypothetical protein
VKGFEKGSEIHFPLGKAIIFVQLAQRLLGIAVIIPQRVVEVEEEVFVFFVEVQGSRRFGERVLMKLQVNNCGEF